MATKEIYEKAKYGDCTPDELALFKEDETKIKRIRHIIQNFDSFLPKDNKIKVPSNAIACLLIWAAPIKKNAFYKYFLSTYKDAGGKYSVPNYSAMCNSSYTVTKNEKFAQYVEKFKNFK